ncbi:MULTISPECIES: TetR/AcrR family transcriptional regulator [unclassified Variovorax]|uniref:TetR/AcrR family transcriptional regulator n=1 Tax=Variovorax TaxID=34072 RepID=UPI0010D0FD2E|nr:MULTISPECIES: TetR/AcrR family transcriptional regulator [unclassified Variovorax]MBB3643047.1 AcrR family transcriptional regulator [Variovorax sp. BK613]
MRAARKATEPRKLPRQQRSHLTVDAITQAAAYILVNFGWERLTTNAVAERAGVNISSLYQYFPNKEAIVAELQRRHILQTQSKLAQALVQLPAQRTLREALVLLVQAMVDEHRIAPAVHRAIADELPRSVRCEIDNEDRVEQLRKALEPYARHVPDLRVAIRIGLVAAHAVIHEATSHDPAVLERPQFVDEVVALLYGYLRRPRLAAP